MTMHTWTRLNLEDQGGQQNSQRVLTWNAGGGLAEKRMIYHSGQGTRCLTRYSSLAGCMLAWGTTGYRLTECSEQGATSLPGAISPEEEEERKNRKKIHQRRKRRQRERKKTRNEDTRRKNRKKEPTTQGNKHIHCFFSNCALRSPTVTLVAHAAIPNPICFALRHAAITDGYTHCVPHAAKTIGFRITAHRDHPHVRQEPAVVGKVLMVYICFRSRGSIF